jgi:hypothetical protein
MLVKLKSKNPSKLSIETGPRYQRENEKISKVKQETKKATGGTSGMHANQAIQPMGARRIIITRAGWMHY